MLKISIFRYIILFVLTILALLLWPTSGLSFYNHFGDMVECVRKSISFHGTKEKNEDDECEYDMIWSADGSMHLVKKVSTKPVTRTSDRGSVERCFCSTFPWLSVPIRTVVIVYVCSYLINHMLGYILAVFDL